MRLFPLFEHPGQPRSTSPMGMPMCQNRLAVPTWSYAMEVYPPRQVIEIGTYSGGLAVALGLHARVIGATMTTYDVNRAMESLVPIGKALGVTFRTGSCWDVTLEREIAEIIARPGPTFVLCDGGNKLRELATFSAFLKPGDVIAAHDYDAVHDAGDIHQPQLERPWPFSEIRREQAEAAIAGRDLEPFLQDHFDLAGWLAYRRRAADA